MFLFKYFVEIATVEIIFYSNNLIVCMYNKLCLKDLNVFSDMNDKLNKKHTSNKIK